MFSEMDIAWYIKGYSKYQPRRAKKDTTIFLYIIA